MRELTAITIMLLGCYAVERLARTDALTNDGARRLQQRATALEGNSWHVSDELHVSDISVVDKNNLWAVGQVRTRDATNLGSVIFRSSDGGQSWVKQLVDVEHQFTDVHFVNIRVGWICGANGLILKTTDRGATWAIQNATTQSDLGAIQFINLDQGWSIGFGGEVLRTTNGGLSWVSDGLPASDAAIFFLNFSDRLHGWILGEKDQAYESTDGGVNWRSRGKELISLLGNENSIVEFRAVKFVNAMEGFIAADVRSAQEGQFYAKGVVLMTRNAGRNWNASIATNSLGLKSAEFMKNHIWVVTGHPSQVLHSRDGGQNWKREFSLDGHNVSRLFFSDSNNGWAIIGESLFRHRILYTRNGGESWNNSKMPD